MFIARIEFYTMLMLSVVFLPFGVTERLSFLSNSAISMMFNSGAKMMVISFLQVMIAKVFSAYLGKLTANPFKDFTILIQILIMCVFFAYITKKIPDLVSSFLNGSPALSGGGMIQQAKSWGTKAATGVAMGVGAGAAAMATAGAPSPLSAMSAVKNAPSGMKMSALKKAAGDTFNAMRPAAKTVAWAGFENAVARNPLTQSFASGAKAVVGSDGSLQDPQTGFAKRVQRLAGLTVDGKDGDNKSIFSRAANPVPPEGVAGKGGNGGSGGQGNQGETKPGFAFTTNSGGGSQKNINQTVNNMSQQSVNMNEAKNNTNVQNMSAQNNSSSTQGSGPSINQVINQTNQQTVSRNDYKNNSNLFMSQLNNYK